MKGESDYDYDDHLILTMTITMITQGVSVTIKEVGDYDYDTIIAYDNGNLARNCDYEKGETTMIMMTTMTIILQGVIVTMKGEGDYDFLSRYFAPWVAIPEDPVTGTA